MGYRRLRVRGLEVEVRGEPKNRFPDLAVIRDEHIPLLQQRDTLRLSMPPPVLVVEVVSPGDVQRDRDYIANRQQYQDRGIPEYWLIDPLQAQMLVLTLTDGSYQGQPLQGEAAIASIGLPNLQLTVDQLLGLA